MLGLFLIYFLGKSFYTLAEEYEKSKWGYAVLGVVSYYGGTMIGATIIFIIAALFFDQDIEETNELLINLLSLPFGILSAYLTYKLLEKRFNKETIPIVNSSDILDDDLML